MKTIINQSVAILCDGNNIERSIQSQTQTNAMLNFDVIIPRLLNGRGLNRLIYFREGKQISSKLADRLHENFFGSVVPCHKSADIPLSIKATQLASKVDTIIILSGDSDYVDLVRHLKSEGVRVEISAVRENSARILLEEADYFHPITKGDWFEYTKQQRYIKNQRQSNMHQDARKFIQNKNKDLIQTNEGNAEKKIEADHLDIIKQKLQAQSNQQEQISSPDITIKTEERKEKTSTKKKTIKKKTAQSESTKTKSKTKEKKTPKKKGLISKILKK